MITSIWTGPGGDASAARLLRQQVLVEELGLDPALTWDTTDAYAYHLVLVMNDEPVAAGRITYGGAGTASLGRICVAKRYRRQGIGDGLVKVLDYKASTLGMKYSQVESPEELVPFYRRIGYVPIGEPTKRWGLTLISMKKETNDGTREGCTHQCAGS